MSRITFIFPDETDLTVEDGTLLPVGSRVSFQPAAPSIDGLAYFRVAEITSDLRVYPRGSPVQFCLLEEDVLENAT